MTRRQRRMAAVAVLVLGVGGAAALAFTAFRNNMMYFYTPTDLLARRPPAGAVMDLGGLVQRGTVVRGKGLDIRFLVTDCRHAVPVRYDGVLPDLFRAGQGVVITGRMDRQGTFIASRILAKHDSRYMPPQVAREVRAADLKGRRDCGDYQSIYHVPRGTAALAPHGASPPE